MPIIRFLGTRSAPTKVLKEPRHACTPPTFDAKQGVHRRLKPSLRPTMELKEVTEMAMNTIDLTSRRGVTAQGGRKGRNYTLKGPSLKDPDGPRRNGRAPGRSGRLLPAPSTSTT